jgi:hypothetical protein
VSYFVDAENELAMYDLFVRCCDHWLQRYSSTQDQDAAFVEDPSSPVNVRMVRLLLYEEKRAITYLRSCFTDMAEFVRANGAGWEHHVSLLDGHTAITAPPPPAQEDSSYSAESA